MERIVRASHKPCLVTPKEYQPVEKVLIAYDRGKTCQKALRYLEDLSIFKPLEIHLVTIANNGAKMAKEYLNTAQTKLIKAVYMSICNLLYGDASTEIINYIRKNQINFLIMGAYGHSRIRYLVIGSTTAHMLHSYTIPVILFR